MKRLRCRGMALVEAALTLPVCLAVLAFTLSFGRQTWYTAVLDKATADAARYVASVPLESLQDGSRRSAVLSAAEAMLAEALASAGIPATLLNVEIGCANMDCAAMPASEAPQWVVVRVQVYFTDSILYRLTEREQVMLSSVARVGRDN